jgi:hypothetical protein
MKILTTVAVSVGVDRIIELKREMSAEEIFRDLDGNFLNFDEVSSFYLFSLLSLLSISHSAVQY